ncbi:MAG: hypothetical protein RI960_142 [Pseudomonadota bacterium]
MRCGDLLNQGISLNQPLVKQFFVYLVLVRQKTRFDDG